jgi:flavin-binding protein dodecin
MKGGQPNKRLAAAQRKVREWRVCQTNAADLHLSSRPVRRFFQMKEHIYKKLELVGSSKKSIEDAVQNALARAGKTMRNMRWFEVVETRGHIEKNKIDHWQVTIKKK